MSLISLTCASGAPGVSSTALGMALTWQSPCLLVEADPSGSSSLGAGYWRGDEMPTGHTTADLSIPVRDGVLEDALPSLVGRIKDTETYILPGALGHTQAAGIASDVWAKLASVLSGPTVGQDAIIDLGRLGQNGTARPLMAASDLILLVLRCDLPSVVGALSWAKGLRMMRADSASGLGLLLITSETKLRRTVPVHTPREISKTLGLPVIATIPDSPEDAAVYSHGASPARRHGAFTKALSAAGQRTRAAIKVNADSLDSIGAPQ